MNIETRLQRRVLNTLSYLLLIVVVIFGLFPIVWSVITSIRPEAEVLTDKITYLPHQLTGVHYQNLWNRTDFPLMFYNSAIVTVVTIALAMAFSVLAAYSLSRYRMRYRTGVLLFYMAIQMFPAVLMLIPIFVLWRNAGLLNTKTGLALAEVIFILPVAIWMLKGFFDAIPVDIEDAARIDGCTRVGALLRVVLPIARPGMVATGIFAGIVSWNNLLFPMLLTTTRDSMTWPVGLQSLVGEFQLSWGMLSAGGVISIVPVIICFLFIQRTLVRGLMAGALKG